METYSKLDNFVESISQDPQLRSRIAHIEVIKAKKAEFRDFPSDIHEALKTNHKF